jgi:hypothetical protein
MFQFDLGGLFIHVEDGNVGEDMDDRFDEENDDDGC